MMTIRKNYSMEEDTFRECFNQKWKEAINRSVISECFLARKAVIKNVLEIIFYLKPQYLPPNEEQRTFT